MKHSEQIVDFLDQNFNKNICHEMSRQYQFIKRSTSTLHGHEFIKTMILPSEGFSEDSLKGLCKRMKSYNPDADLSSQALSERINNASASRLMHGLFGKLLAKLHEKVKQSPLEISTFARVLLQDSTIFTLNEHLESSYKGTRRGNNCVESQVKIDLIHDISNGTMIDAQLFNGNDPDQGLSDRVLRFIKPNDLIVRDLGYFSISTFKAIGLAGAFFLTRMKSGVHFYLNKDDKEPLDISEYLKRKISLDMNVIEINGYLGKDKVSARLVIYRQSEGVTNQRIRVANKHSRKKGETLSKNKKLLLSLSIFVTNAPVTMLSTATVGTIYRLRWEIELIFKRWKSQLNIDYLKGIKKNRIDCMIWGRLCMVIILELIIWHLKIMAIYFKAELSEVKVIQYLLRENSLCRAIQSNYLQEYFAELEKDIARMLLKDKRLRKTMRERAINEESYYGALQVVEIKQHTA